MNISLDDEMIKHGFSYEGARALFEFYENFDGRYFF
jgi:hypothetical protein